MEGERILHYRLIGTLGQGGMGEVVLAEDERLGRRVALKFLSRSFAADPHARERLEREARSLAALSHPHIAAIHALEEAVEPGGRPRLFLVMEYVEGETLAQSIARRPLPVEDVLSVGLGVADALAHAHARGVIHRDVKPANILIRPDGTAVLTDFGIADLESATRLTAEGYTPGTVAYMSPEQARGARVDARSDLFSLGAALYEALTGARPFAGDRPESALYAVQHDQPEPPTARRTGIPLELERIVMKCLRKDPAHRYQHADDLAADLRAMAATATATGVAVPAAAASLAGADAPTQTLSPGTAMDSTAPGAPPPARRVRRVAMLTAAALVALALVYLAGRPGSDHDDGTAEAAEKSIAVLSFQNLAEPGDPSGSGPIATSLLSVGLGQMQVMPVLSAQRIHDVMRQMGKSGASVQGAEALEVARKAGASHVVTGFIYAVRPEVVLGAEVASTASGKVLTATRVRTPAGEAALFTAVDSLTRSLLDGLARSGFRVNTEDVDVAGLTTRNPLAYRSYVRGLDKLYLGSTDAAGEEFQEAVAADSTFALAWYYAAIANWWSNEYTTAEDEVAAALRLNDRLTPREREGLKALDHLIRGRYREAVAAYQTLLTRYPDDKEFAYGLGEAFYHSDADPRATREALERATRLDPTFGVAYVHLIDVEMAANDPNRALAHLDRLRQANPESPGAAMLRGGVFSRMGDAARAIASYREALTLEPRLGDAYFEIVRVHSALGQFDSARVVIARLKGAPVVNRTAAEDAELVLLMASGRYREALRLYRSIPEEETQPGRRLAPVRYYHRTALLERDGVAQAIRETEEFAHNPTLARIFGRGSQDDDLAELYIRTGQVAKAERLLRDYDREIAESPTSDERKNRIFVAGLIALAKGRPREALPLLEQGMPMGPPGRIEGQYASALSRGHLAIGDTARAIEALAPATTAETRTLVVADLFHSMNSLAALYEKTGRRDEALNLYRRVVHQYREGDPKLTVRDVALAGIRRLAGSA